MRGRKFTPGAPGKGWLAAAEALNRRAAKSAQSPRGWRGGMEWRLEESASRSHAARRLSALDPLSDDRRHLLVGGHISGGRPRRHHHQPAGDPRHIPAAAPAVSRRERRGAGQPVAHHLALAARPAKLPGRHEEVRRASLAVLAATTLAPAIDHAKRLAGDAVTHVTAPAAPIDHAGQRRFQREVGRDGILGCHAHGIR